MLGVSFFGGVRHFCAWACELHSAALTAKLKRIWTPEEDAIISGFYGEKLQEMDVKSVNKLLMDNEPWNELLSRVCRDRT